MAVSILQAQPQARVIAHRRVPTKPKYSPIRKRPILRALRHSKSYLNT
ncbi:hypothetical protein F383_38368 [Gossypium arboreum]|uniref:Uncharacterized protein n=1 Tax=Gossypium arboreum TaxID=29729 RepID=A0A0B0MIY8_GOSAR|nr:hypothetical protein F383_38368 [Gossypium arboreum]